MNFSELTLLIIDLPLLLMLEILLRYYKIKGLSLSGSEDVIIEDYIIEKLGAPPPIGEYFELEGFTGVMGNVQGFLAVGFYPQPDVIEAVYIIEKAE